MRLDLIRGLALALVASCSSTTKTDGGDSVCDALASRPCFGHDTCVGTQKCDSRGAWGDCVCGGAEGGTGTGGATDGAGGGIAGARAGGAAGSSGGVPPSGGATLGGATPGGAPPASGGAAGSSAAGVAGTSSGGAGGSAGASQVGGAAQAGAHGDSGGTGAAGCGNGRVDAVEACDDGNAVGCDGCDSCEERRYLGVPDTPTDALGPGIITADTPQAITIEAWVKLAGTAAGAHHIIDTRANATDTRGFGLNVNTYQVQFWVSDSTVEGTSRYTLPLSIEAGSWTHVAAVFDGTRAPVTKKIFIDGEVQGALQWLSYGAAPFEEVVAWNVGNTTRLLASATTTASGNRFVGEIDELRISRSARYAKTFVPSRRLAVDAETVALWHFDEASGPATDEVAGVAIPLPATVARASEECLVAVSSSSVEPAGDNCAHGGTREERGWDDNSDGALQSDEVNWTAFQCTVTSGNCPSTMGPSMARLPDGFCIDRTEVTRAQYGAWLSTNPSTASQDASECGWNATYQADAACMSHALVCQTGCDQEPQVCVDWCDAAAYCRAAGKRLCGSAAGGHVPWDYVGIGIESQWVSACTSGGINTFTYGDLLDETTCISGSNHDSSGNTVAVDAYPACQSSVSGYTGITHLSGNVSEWENSCSGDGEAALCATRGGGFEDTPSWLACETSWVQSDTRATATVARGFRCCAE